MVSFTSSTDYTPDSNILIDEPLRPNEDHSPSDIRPTNSGDGPSMEIAYSPDPFASVTIDLDVPGIVNSALDVETIHIEGNVASLTVYHKVDDDATTWTIVTGVTVGPDGVMSWPVTGSYETVGVIKLVPTEPDSLDDEYYIMKVNIIGCAEAYSKFSDVFKEKFRGYPVRCLVL